MQDTHPSFSPAAPYQPIENYAVISQAGEHLAMISCFSPALCVILTNRRPSGQGAIPDRRYGWRLVALAEPASLSGAQIMARELTDSV